MSSGRRADFGTADSTSEAVQTTRLGSLVWDYVPPRGAPATIDFRSESNPRIARVLLAAIRFRTEVSGSIRSRATVLGYSSLSCRFLRTVAIGGDVDLGCADLGAHHVAAFEASLAHMKGAQAQNSMITLIAVLRTARDEGLAEFHPTVAERLSYSTRVYEDDGVPIDGFDDAVTTALLSAAREDIEATIARRGVGEGIVAGTASSGDEILDRCVRWIAANGWAATACHARAASDMTTRLAAGRWDQAHGFLHLELADLPPLAVWGGLLTGLEPEILDALEQSDVPTAGQGRFDLDYFKARAKAFRTRRFRRGFTDDITTPGGFLRTVANLSEHSRQASGDPALFQLKTQYGIRRRAKKSSWQAMAAWLNRRSIPVGDGNVLARLDRRQLRKTYYRLDYESHRGVLPLLGHSRRVAARHYADTPANRPLHERIIEEALHDAATVAGPRVVRGHELQSRSPGQVAEELDIDEGTAEDVIAGDADVFLATCTGLTNSPYAAAGTVCPRSFDGTCFRCRNALVTERTLPAILMFKRHVEGQRTCWPRHEWLRRFGQTYEAIEDCLSHFDEAELASAEPAQISGIGSDR